MANIQRMKNYMLAVFNGPSALENEPAGVCDGGATAAAPVRAPTLSPVPATWRQAPEPGQDRWPAVDCAACRPAPNVKLKRLDAAIFTQQGFNLSMPLLTHCGFCLTAHICPRCICCSLPVAALVISCA